MFFGRRAQQGGHAERKAMIDKKRALPITRQAKALKLSRGTVY
jgi:putative transposase